MKKILTALSCLALAAMVSCQKEILTDGNAVRTTNFKGVTLTVGTGSEDTKVHSDNLLTKWNTDAERMCVLALQYDTVAKYQFIKPKLSGVTLLPNSAAIQWMRPLLSNMRSILIPMPITSLWERMRC